MHTGPEGTGYVHFTVGIWYDKNDGSIRIASQDTEPAFITTVNANRDSKRGHPNLYGHLKDILVKADRWPEPEA